MLTFFNPTSSSPSYSSLTSSLSHLIPINTIPTPMELMPKPTITTTIFFLFLLAAPYLSTEEVDSESVYEIDYRGPETHSHYRPSPGGSGHLPLIHGQAGSSPTSKSGIIHGKKVHE